MMRFTLMVVTVVFTGLIGVLTVLDMVHNGVTWLDLVAIVVVVLFATGIIGALWQWPRQ